MNVRVLACVTQVSESLGDEVKILKVDVDENPQLSSQLQVSVCANQRTSVVITSYYGPCVQPHKMHAICV
jgi:hypothetical protein